MSVPCEIAVKCVLPVVRAMIARELMSNLKVKQIDAAKLLGVSQPAISMYHRSLRGKALDLENDVDIRRLVTKMALSLVKSNPSRKEMILMYCEICKVIRSKGLLCKLHRVFDPSVDIASCGLCVTEERLGCV